MDEYLHTQLNQQAGEVLYNSCDSHIEIRQLGELRWMHFGGDAVQACMSLSQSHQLFLPYTEAMLAGLVFIEQPKRLLNLGLGGASFIRFFDKTLPKMLVESVDSSVEVIDLCRRFLRFQKSAHYIIWRLRPLLLRGVASYEAIFCDLFADGTHLDYMLDEAFYGN